MLKLVPTWSQQIDEEQTEIRSLAVELATTVLSPIESRKTCWSWPVGPQNFNSSHVSPSSWCDEVLSRKARDPKMSKAPEIHKISKICCYFADDEGKLSTIAYVFLLKCFKVNSLIFTRKIWYFLRVNQKSNRNWSLSPPLFFFAHWAREKVWFPYWKSFPFSRSGENKRKK